MFRRVLLLMLLLLNGIYNTVSAQIPIYSWRDHLSWNTAEIVVVADRKLFYSNGTGICTYDMTSRNLEKLTKVNGLNDAGITAMQYSAANSSVVIGYVNGNIDIVAGNNVYNIPELKRSSIYSNKRINNIYVSGNNAYLSCAFGIIVVDLRLRQVRDTYIIGDNGNPVEVFSLTEYDGYFYAAINQGLKRADSNSRQLTDFSFWKNVDDAPAQAQQTVSTYQRMYVSDMDNNIHVFDGNTWNNLFLPFPAEKIRSLSISGNNMLVSASNAVFIFNTLNNTLQNTFQTHNNQPIVAYDAVLDNDGTCWIADNRQGLIRVGTTGDYLPNGPKSNHAAAFRFKDDRLLVVSGGKNTNGMPLNRQGEIHILYANEWTTITPPDALDFTDVDIAENQPNTYYVSSWGQGLYVFENGALKAQYKQNNSTLTADDSGNVFCAGLMMDADNNLWVSNNNKVNLLSGEKWRTLPFETTASYGRLTSDNYGQIWTTQGNNGLFVFDKKASEQGHNDANISFKPNLFNSNEHIDVSNRIVNTPDGVIWVATTKGPIYYQNPSVILNGIGVGGVHPRHPGSFESNYLYALFGSENILSIAIDGANRKWFATETAGVFLIEEDNRGEVKHFNTENSPLLSNKVHDIAINDKTGEVFFATEYGIVSYRSDAVSGGDDFGKVYAFPHPVRPDYHGDITITGLIKEADVKITDIAGNLVYQTRSLGGQAVWNGKNRQGRRVATGIYLVFCTNDDGSKTHVAKIMFIR